MTLSRVILKVSRKFLVTSRKFLVTSRNFLVTSRKFLVISRKFLLTSRNFSKFLIILLKICLHCSAVESHNWSKTSQKFDQHCNNRYYSRCVVYLFSPILINGSLCCWAFTFVARENLHDIGSRVLQKENEKKAWVIESNLHKGLALTSWIFLSQYERLLKDSRLVTSYIKRMPIAPR